jgi:hypothetical protein
VWLDRDDARRQQLERDALAKLRVARADLEVSYPTDAAESASEADRTGPYGVIRIRVGDAERETWSTSRRELVTLIFEAAGRSLPDWSQPDYLGYPLVVEGSRRRALASLAYLGLPLGLVIAGWFATRRSRT